MAMPGTASAVAAQVCLHEMVVRTLKQLLRQVMREDLVGQGRLGHVSQSMFQVRVPCMHPAEPRSLGAWCL